MTLNKPKIFRDIDTINASLGEKANKSNLPVNVKDYGAKGDGITDDTTAVNLAMAQSSVLYFPHGTYKFSSSIYVKNCSFIGEDSLCTIISTPVVVMGNNSVIKNFTLDSTLKTYSIGSINIYSGASNITIDNLTFQNAINGDSIRITGDAYDGVSAGIPNTNITIRNCKFLGNNSITGIMIYSYFDKLTIEHCRFEDKEYNTNFIMTSQDAPNGSNNRTNLTIIDNYFGKYGRMAVEIAYATNLILRDNVFNGIYTDVGFMSSFVLSIIGCQNVFIENNKAFATGGIELGSMTGQAAKNIFLLNNYFDVPGCSLNTSENSAKTVIYRGNYFSNLTGARNCGYAGSSDSENTENHIFENNILYNCNTIVSTKGGIIKNNLFYRDTYQGSFVISGQNNVTIEGNRIITTSSGSENLQTDKPCAIAVLGTTNVINNVISSNSDLWAGVIKWDSADNSNIISDNVINGVTDYAILLSGTKTIDAVIANNMTNCVTANSVNEMKSGAPTRLAIKYNNVGAIYAYNGNPSSYGTDFGTNGCLCIDTLNGVVYVKESGTWTVK